MRGITHVIVGHVSLRYKRVILVVTNVIVTTISPKGLCVFDVILFTNSVAKRDHLPV